VLPNHRGQVLHHTTSIVDLEPQRQEERWGVLIVCVPGMNLEDDDVAGAAEGDKIEEPILASREFVHLEKSPLH
jgi:hypothetical protein